MLSLNDPMIKREIIMDHYENPRNKGLVDDPRYLKVNMNSESCIDDDGLRLTVIITLSPNCGKLKSAWYRYGENRRFSTKELAIQEAEKECERILDDLSKTSGNWSLNGQPMIKEKDDGVRVVIPVKW